MTIEQIARVAHEANRAYCMALGDFSQPVWDEAPDWQRTSAINGVSAIVTGKCSTPEESHQGWMAEKVAAGWVWGPTKDADAKTHPCLVPYAQLPAEQRMKDHLFNTVVNALKSVA